MKTKQQRIEALTAAHVLRGTGMNATSGLWQTSYAHDRRIHRHRCRYCHRIVQAGETVWMARVGTRTTFILHAEPCADARYSSMTWLELLACHAVGYAAGATVFGRLSEAQMLAAARAAIARAAKS